MFPTSRHHFGTVSQDKAVTIQPKRVARVEAHGFAEERDADRGRAHGCSRMASFIRLNDVGGEAADSREDERVRGDLSRENKSQEGTQRRILAAKESTFGFVSLLSSDTGRGVACGILQVSLSRIAIPP